MTLQIASGHLAPAAKKVHSAIGRCPVALMAVSAGFFAISISSHGADLGTGYATAIAVPPQAAPAGRRPIPAHPIDPPGAKPDRSMQRYPDRRRALRAPDALVRVLVGIEQCLNHGWVLKLPRFWRRPTENRQKWVTAVTHFPRTEITP